jgi:hypothetical protein
MDCIVVMICWYFRFLIPPPPWKLSLIVILLQTTYPPLSDDIISERSLSIIFNVKYALISFTKNINHSAHITFHIKKTQMIKVKRSVNRLHLVQCGSALPQPSKLAISKKGEETSCHELLSKPKFNQQLNWTEFEVRLHSYCEVHTTGLNFCKLCTVTTSGAF